MIMVTSRNRSSTAAATTAPANQLSESTTSSSSRVPKVPLDEWTTREKLYLASLALKHNNSWNSVARQMQPFVEKDRPDGFSNQKTCASQFDKLMNELGVDKRPKRNEPTDASGSVIYKKMAEKRIKELEESIVELRKSWLQVSNDLKALDEEQSTTKEVKQEQVTTTTPGKQKGKQLPPSATKTLNTSKASTSATNEQTEKLPTRALTRRESSRQNLEKTFSILYQEAIEIKSLNKLCKPSADVEKALGSYDKVVLQHVDMNTIKQKFSGEIEDPYALMNDFLLMFQNATIYYPTDHPTYKLAIELREKLVPQWERQIIERHRTRH